MIQEQKNKYAPLVRPFLNDRKWPSQEILTAPLWCSVDLRDGNQALANPMSLAQKVIFFKMLVEIGFEEIEVGFPSAAEIEFNFIRTLIEQGYVNSKIIPQVLTQARDHLIKKTFESLKGAEKAIVHLYNSTSELQRRVVFKLSKAEIKNIAVAGTKLIKKLSLESDSEIIFEYSPESFTGTEIDYAVEVCNAVLDTWKPSPDKKAIINLPSTVEVSSPNVFADTIEYFCRKIQARDSIIISVHNHNDRGTGVATSELALLAGAERIEGTLFGNGERSGNVDLVTLALNMLTLGVDPKLKFNELEKIKTTYAECTGMKIHERHPYAGELVFTAFSGSHQDAIKKGFDAAKPGNIPWEIPYLPIDPTDIGRSYEAIIRINSQSGKGGIAYVLEREFSFNLPKKMHPEVGSAIQNLSDKMGRELLPVEILNEFKARFLDLNFPFEFVNFKTERHSNAKHVSCEIEIKYYGNLIKLSGDGNGPIEAAKNAICSLDKVNFEITDYSEHALSSGAMAEAISYLQIKIGNNEKDKTFFGSGIDSDTGVSAIKALIVALNRSY